MDNHKQENESLIAQSRAKGANLTDVVMPRKFEMSIEPHTPSDASKPCFECVLAHGPMCLDRSYCEFRRTGKTWRKSAS